MLALVSLDEELAFRLGEMGVVVEGCLRCGVSESGGEIANVCDDRFGNGMLVFWSGLDLLACRGLDVAADPAKAELCRVLESTRALSSLTRSVIDLRSSIMPLARSSRTSLGVLRLEGGRWEERVVEDGDSVLDFAERAARKVV